MSRNIRHPEAKMASAPILVFPDWNKEFHVHVDVSSTALGVVIAQLGEGDLDHCCNLTDHIGLPIIHIKCIHT